MKIEERLKVLENLKNDLLSNIKNELISLYVYGSTLNVDFCKYSDFDVLLVYRDELNFIELEKIKELKEKYESGGIFVDIGVHTLKEMPIVRGKMFWHNNRGIFMQKEILMYGKLMYGVEHFGNFLFTLDELKDECVKVIHSLKYNQRKYISTHPRCFQTKKMAMKYALYAITYGLAYFSIFPKNKIDTYKEFDLKFNLSVKATDLLKIKMNNYEDDYDVILFKTYAFLNELDSYIFSDYNNTTNL